jgi:Dolichyl-phosphate-mannose-protein mannosyltransferase
MTTLPLVRGFANSCRTWARALPHGLVVWILVACVFNLIWIQLNAAPPRSWDDAEYLADSVTTYHALERGDLEEFLRLASRPARGVHPPMTKLLPLPMYVLFGAGTRPALYAFTALIPVFCVYVFLLGRVVSRNDKTAVLAVIITCCFPLTYGLWRLVMAEFGLGVAAIASQYHLFRCAEAKSRSVRQGILAGAFIGWGLLWKVSFPVFVAGPLCHLLFRYIRAWKDPAQRSSIVLTLAAIAAVALAVAGPFYFLRIRSLLEFVIYNSSASASLEQFSLGPVLSPITVVKYWVALVNFGSSAYFFLLFAGFTTFQLVHRKSPLPRSGMLAVGLCGIIPLIFFSLQYLKEPRHLFPAFAMFGIVIAALLQDSLVGTTARMRAAVLTTTLMFPSYQFIFLSFEVPWRPSKDIRLGPLVLLFADRESLFVRPANSTPWPVEEVVQLISAHSIDILGRAARVRMAGHIPFLDGPGLNYESVLHYHQPLAYNTVGDRSLHPTWWDFVVVLTGPVRNRVEYREPVLATLLSEQRLPFALLGRVTLPEGREAVLYHATSSASLEGRTIGENLVTTTDRRGQDLFPVSRAAWDLPGGPRRVAVERDGTSIEFQYVYVPDTTRFLTWQVVRNGPAMCGDSAYAVKVFDLNSRRGPTQEVARVFSMAAAQKQESASLGIETFRDQIVTIQLSPLSSTEASHSCIGWSDVTMVADRGRPDPVR